jgi:hypothetical protein
MRGVQQAHLTQAWQLNHFAVLVGNSTQLREFARQTCDSEFFGELA